MGQQIGLELIALIKSVPSVIWSGVVASLITVFGVYLTNLGLSRRHREQLAASARESALQRKMQLRRDVFLPAVGAVVKSIQAVTRLADPTAIRSEIDKEYTAAIAEISQVNAVGMPSTVEAVGILMRCVNLIYGDLIVLRGPIEEAQHRAMASGAMVDRAVADQTRWVTTQTDLYYNGPVQPDKLEFINRQLEFCQRQFNSWSTSRQVAASECQTAVLQALKKLSEHQSKFRDSSANANIALRSELGLSEGDEEALAKVLKANDDHSQKQLIDMINRTEAGIRRDVPTT